MLPVKNNIKLDYGQCNSGKVAVILTCSGENDEMRCDDDDDAPPSPPTPPSVSL